MVSLTVSGSSDIMNSTLYSLCSLISDGLTFNYSGTPLVLSPYMNYDGSTFYGVSCNVVPSKSSDSSSGGSMVAIIVGVCVGILVLIAIIIVILVWKWKAFPKINSLVDYKYGMNFPEKFPGNGFMRPTSAGSINTSLLFRGSSFTSDNSFGKNDKNGSFFTNDSFMRTVSSEKNGKEAPMKTEDGTSLAGNDDMMDILFRERTDLGINTPPTNTFNI